MNWNAVTDPLLNLSNQLLKQAALKYSGAQNTNLPDQTTKGEVKKAEEGKSKPAVVWYKSPMVIAGGIAAVLLLYFVAKK